MQVRSHHPNHDLLWLELRAQWRSTQRRYWRTQKPEDALAFRRLDANEGDAGSEGGQRARAVAGAAQPSGVHSNCTQNHIPPKWWSCWQTRSRQSQMPSPRARQPNAPPVQNVDAAFKLHGAALRHRGTSPLLFLPGMEGITAQARRTLYEFVLPRLLGLINAVWSTTDVPVEWYTVISIPLFKSGKDSSKPGGQARTGPIFSRRASERRWNNRRPAGLHLRLPQAEVNGGRHRELVSSLEEAQAQEHSAAMVFLDISKAFDTPPRFTIISALRSLSFHGRSLACVRAFLGNRTMQDPVLSPLLFSIAMFLLPANAVEESVLAFFIDKAVYVDDVALRGTAI
ncbi:hypothetical protein HPB47_013863 [Ixodes persulcatus]|uniref:Uncharacterized protein n=1 Tax=Ixodes persulcatus TaxID=34615 RepID=A0AC60QYI9_IXOPE|nr:hypothetical protein HPB47_013863 [Ixodes persulcatus]